MNSRTVLIIRSRWAEHLYSGRYRDTNLPSHLRFRMLEPEYRYSDLGYYLFQQVIEQETDTMLYPYVWYSFFAPMRARKPLLPSPEQVSPRKIVPTENDIFFRTAASSGHVHDVGAAMLGGIAGHAGLFGTANDVGKMMQMFLNEDGTVRTVSLVRPRWQPSPPVTIVRTETGGDWDSTGHSPKIRNPDPPAGMLHP